MNNIDVTKQEAELIEEIEGRLDRIESRLDETSKLLDKIIEALYGSKTKTN